MKKDRSILSYFGTFALYNLCFLGLQFFLIYSQSNSLVSSIKLPTQIYLEFAGTLCVHIILYLILSLIQTWLLIGVLKRSWHHFSAEQWQLFIWSLFVWVILSANAYYFPLSVFSKLFSPPIPEFYIMILYCLSLFCLGLLLLNRLLYRSSAVLLVLLMPIILYMNFFYFKPVPIHEVNSQPNIIILGIDSLSPESVKKKNMPFLYQLLNNSTQFTNAISPLARTYPAWCSILTGLYSEHHHADENLVEKSTVNNQASIIWELNKLGYNTVYATDDRRFNSLDKDFGFQKLIGPKLGINDIILGFFNDFPLGNLLINFRISSGLFPYNHSNRASFFSYYPNTFSAKLERELALQPRNKPIFLAVHFALPHWPYAWAKSLPDEVNNEFSLSSRNSLYQSALKRVDKQFHSFYNYLEQNHYLTNSLVIILSDHGETLYYPNSRLTNYQNYQSSLSSRLAEYFKNKTATELDKSAGHGSDILSPNQYHSVLAFKIFNHGTLITGTDKINTRVALIDLAPTILSFLKVHSKHNMDGISLLNSVLNSQSPLPQRTFFIESGMYPNQDFSKEKAIEIGHQIYKVNPKTGELELKPNELIKINHDKLYGVISGDWILALYPDDNSYIPVIQNLKTGQWIDNLDTDFAKSTPAAQLAKDLQNFYGKKLAFPIP
ncbi:sulfatase-like hydrolase/transferase [Legionella bononiensis]|uniref:Sulfatase-like hydrolase/transferase n=1 Tax=Legionella bononiensis TaxID=2793102 RepID=A0ABS1WGB3_9GAMM|nr:sulfatase-like hydrolase/transferase [Legionella bononiensis]MBL7481843.1 sulfatase-like hydrolase/transferase [Legionella bononiensis]MBL7528392.1 sulfatase-like hydrolase/transferase [Legionella bononiensis]MBL7564355.1 sulfatase-like hydrolase/transferase [Legionella bononiensis]